MTDAKNLREVVQVLKEFGVSYFKNSEIELKLDISTSTHQSQKASVITPAEAAHVPVEITEQEKEEIKHKLEEMTSVLNMSDTDLLDRLFPDSAAKEEIEE